MRNLAAFGVLIGLGQFGLGQGPQRPALARGGDGDQGVGLKAEVLDVGAVVVERLLAGRHLALLAFVCVGTGGHGFLSFCLVWLAF